MAALNIHKVFDKLCLGSKNCRILNSVFGYFLASRFSTFENPVYSSVYLHLRTEVHISMETNAKGLFSQSVVITQGIGELSLVVQVLINVYGMKPGANSSDC